MPDEHHNPGTGRHGNKDGSAGERGRRGRRRSMDTHGGISVSDVVARHTGERPVFDPSADAPAPPPRRLR
ncbi:hypothetical protein, partial [Amycolatopsis pittospori]|uniref:hypothetical protein n=1 Tax=Amycolatopsis pittospori TaxID=2749434 RepID=UPI001A9D700B